MAKMTREQIREGLAQVPIESLILGTQSKEKTLTPKQREFARQVALGETKAGAYRKAYNSQGKAKTQGDAGSRLAMNPGISAEIQAYQAAIEASKHRTPAQLRELVIHQLTKHALDTDVNPAQRLKALELLGKVSEVAAFTERKETLVTHQSGDIKAKLMSIIKGTLSNTVEDIEPNQSYSGADDLLAEIRGATPADAPDAEPTPPPPALSTHVGDDARIHTVSHTNPPQISIEKNISAKSDAQAIDFIEEKNVTETSFSCDAEYSEIEYEVVPGEVPPYDSEMK